jgi:DNA replication and repair protein RecF
MTQIKQLIISNVRNLSSIELTLAKKFNIFVGANGSGKTSLLEAVHLLGLGRSFRARSVHQIIAFNADECIVRAQVEAVRVDNDNNNWHDSLVWVAVKKGKSGVSDFRIGEQCNATAAELTSLLPLQLIDVNSPELLLGGPKNRRQFIDWGVFHVEHTFLEEWRMLQRALEQRNALLKQKQASKEWSEVFVKYALLLDKARRAYLNDFTVVLLQLLDEMLGITNVRLNYQPGWSGEVDLVTAMERTLKLDLAFGYTNCGPHRADLEVLIDERPAKEVLSRGQVKMFICIMFLARARLVRQRHSIFLLDDLHAELDRHSCSLLLTALDKLDCQVLITGIEMDLIKRSVAGFERKLFHVERGIIQELVWQEEAEVV